MSVIRAVVKRVPVLLLCLVYLPVAAQTGNQNQSVSKNDLVAVRKAADRGDAEAQYDLGVMYYFGHGVPQDYARAMVWYRKAAEQGYAEAQGFLGIMYGQGDGVPQNDTKAAIWYRKAAEQGNAGAQNNLGVMYDQGLGVPQDDTRAATWWRKAGEQGLAQAQYSLGAEYVKGHGVPQDDVQAVLWFRKAAEQDNAEAQFALGAAYHEHRGVSQDDTQAAFWWRKAADQRNALAQYSLGMAYHQGLGVPQDDTTATIWWRKAANQGYAIAQAQLGMAYYQGHGVPQDNNEAYFWLDLAASGKTEGVKQESMDTIRDGIAKSLTPAELSRVQERARKWFEDHQMSASASQDSTASTATDGTIDSPQSFAAQYWAQALTSPSKPTADQKTQPKNTEGGSSADSSGVGDKPFQQQTLIDGTRKAAEQGDAKAQYILGLDYSLGVGVPKDITQATVWFRKAAEQGSESAQLRLGGMYETGQGVPQSYEQAAIWYRKAAEQGNASAQQSLKRIAQWAATTSRSQDAQSTMGCATNISFGIANGSQVSPLAPAFTEKWIKKNQKKYPGLCFSQRPNPQATNYLMVFSTSESALNGFQPSLQTTTSTSTTPVYGSGTVTDNYGGMWNYSYSGMATSYTTNTAQVSLPYTLTTSSIYENTYNQSGNIVSQRWRSYTTQRGGNGYSALGTNIGALIRKVHIKEHLLRDALNDVGEHPK